MSDQGMDIRQTCSINGELCINGIRRDFRKDPQTGQPRPCHKWVRLIGKDPQTEKPIDEWCCNEWAQTKIGIENCQMSRFVQSTVDKVASLQAEHIAIFFSALPKETQERIARQHPRLIEHQPPPPQTPPVAPADQG